ncbi:putative leucine-rich repeat domain superfamily [Helianthus annuus]|uniref:Leucine-rich repeat domain superfamily n=1 Tax=Helianthus annuus TaxID=4232 RepID=A0A251RZR1_HELAN|nr:uncharacterized protein At4g06744 [Helianthus annuus]KAF5760347.1 putative leucine-rich repeat domain superfamily [Helianthus annuus]KAJ0438411.1 putative leucine-rich repeat domain superfamily [Helianthus annuus]KAJ0460737.1 putative leucine-rich repeat domain superfamily [Helianthus annuus]KAJ0645065.1 putative leucine-rich repeat domain superfamily [Helianthus annuus]KAJ0821520.1 putative leucine-rich repeat domain superfamily [Helianthus annuus]
MSGVHTLLLFICITHLFAVHGEQIIRRDELEIIIGGGGATPSPPPDDQNCPPPPPPPCPPPPTPKPSPPPPKPPPPPKLSPPPPKLSPPPPTKPPPTPKPTKPPPRPSSGFESERMKLVFPVIQKFKLKVRDDPRGITNTWKGKKICRDYKGFVCDTVPGYNQTALAGVKFNNFNFGGPDLTLTEFLMGLPDIVFFHANSNNFIGSIPPELNKLKYFYELDLSNNKFSGNFPYQVLRGNKLLFLDLRFNKFAGVVPPEVFGLNLDLLFINNNKFIQKLPDNLGQTTALYLTLANNEFIGGIPPSIGQASNTLLEVLFLNNKLTGCLPYQIGLLKKATVFDVGSNYLSGPIPLSFQCLRKMELLNLARNKFHGEVPEAVCGLPKLSNFTVSYNYFTQVGPQCRELIKKGVLDVKMNCILDLPHQRTPEECNHFFSTIGRCPNEKMLTYVPCTGGYSSYQLESLDVAMSGPTTAPGPAQGLGRASYGALSPH